MSSSGVGTLPPSTALPTDVQASNETSALYASIVAVIFFGIIIAIAFACKRATYFTSAKGRLERAVKRREKQRKKALAELEKKLALEQKEEERLGEENDALSNEALLKRCAAGMYEDEEVEDYVDIEMETEGIQNERQSGVGPGIGGVHDTEDTDTAAAAKATAHRSHISMSDNNLFDVSAVYVPEWKRKSASRTLFIPSPARQRPLSHDFAPRVPLQVVRGQDTDCPYHVTPFVKSEAYLYPDNSQDLLDGNRDESDEEGGRSRPRQRTNPLLDRGGHQRYVHKIVQKDLRSLGAFSLIEQRLVNSPMRPLAKADTSLYREDPAPIRWKEVVQ